LYLRNTGIVQRNIRVRQRLASQGLHIGFRRSGEERAPIIKIWWLFRDATDAT
jgi:hypothetical protein